MEWERVGAVTHYFARPGVAVIQLESEVAVEVDERVREGDTVLRAPAV